MRIRGQIDWHTVDILLRARHEKEQNSSMLLIDADSLQNQANRGPCGNVQDQGNQLYANRANTPQLLRQLAEQLTIEPKAKQVIERQNVIGADLLRARLDLWQSVWEQGR